LHIFDCTEMNCGPWVEHAMDNSAKPPPAARRQSNVLQYKELLKTKEANEGTELDTNVRSYGLFSSHVTCG
jgi:hypothetical protein